MSTAVRAKARSVRETAAEHREPVREVVNSAPTQFWDADGLPTVRKNKNGIENEWDFKQHEIPDGVTYQWIRHTVHGDPGRSELLSMQQNGWRPVPWERHQDRFPRSDLQGRGCILMEGQLLVERRASLTQEALQEQKRKADSQIKETFSQFGVQLPDSARGMGINPGNAVARQQSDDVFSVRQDAMPKHQIAID